MLHNYRKYVYYLPCFLIAKRTSNDYTWSKSQGWIQRCGIRSPSSDYKILTLAPLSQPSHCIVFFVKCFNIVIKNLIKPFTLQAYEQQEVYMHISPTNHPSTQPPGYWPYKHYTTRDPCSTCKMLECSWVVNSQIILFHLTNGIVVGLQLLALSLLMLLSEDSYVNQQWEVKWLYCYTYYINISLLVYRC